MGILVRQINRRLFWEDCNTQEDSVLMVFSDREKLLEKRI